MKKFLLGAVLVIAIMVTTTQSAHAFSFSAFWNNLFGNSQVNNADLGASVYGAKTTETSKAGETRESGASAKLGDFEISTLDATSVSAGVATLNGHLFFTPAIIVPSMKSFFMYSQSPHTMTISDTGWMSNILNSGSGTSGIALDSGVTHVNLTNIPTTLPFQTRSVNPSKAVTGLLVGATYYYQYCIGPLGGSQVPAFCGEVKTFKASAASGGSEQGGGPATGPDVTAECKDGIPSGGGSVFGGRQYDVTEKQFPLTTQKPFSVTNTPKAVLGSFEIKNANANICNMKKIHLVSVGNPANFLTDVSIKGWEGVYNGGTNLGTIPASGFAVNAEGYYEATVFLAMPFKVKPTKTYTLEISGTKKSESSLPVGSNFATVGIKGVTHGDPNVIVAQTAGAPANYSNFGATPRGLPLFTTVTAVSH